MSMCAYVPKSAGAALSVQLGVCLVLRASPLFSSIMVGVP
jgi:hypothetical protein